MIECFQDVMDTLGKTLDLIDEELFDKLKAHCNSALDNNKKIVVSGLGKNVPICEKFVGTMNSLGLSASFLHTNSAVHGDLGIVKEGDMIILLTKSGDTEESIYLAKLLKERNVNLWLMSFTKDSKLSKMIGNKFIIDLEHEGDLWNIMPNNSTTLYLIILQVLAMELAKDRNITLEEFGKNHPGGHIGKIIREEC